MNLRLWSVPADGCSQHWASCDWHGDGRRRSSAEGSDRLRWPASLIAFFAASEPNFEAACEHCLPKHDKTVNKPSPSCLAMDRSEQYFVIGVRRPVGERGPLRQRLGVSPPIEPRVGPHLSFIYIGPEHRGMASIFAAAA